MNQLTIAILGTFSPAHLHIHSTTKPRRRLSRCMMVQQPGRLMVAWCSWQMIPLPPHAPWSAAPSNHVSPRLPRPHCPQHASIDLSALWLGLKMTRRLKKEFNWCFPLFNIIRSNSPFFLVPSDFWSGLWCFYWPEGRPHITVLIPNITAPIKQQWGGRITTPCIMAPQYNGPSYGHITTPLYTGSTHLQEGSAWRLQWVGISRWSNIKIYEHTCVWPVTEI